jgi:hypothetical protein
VNPRPVDRKPGLTQSSSSSRSSRSSTDERLAGAGRVGPAVGVDGRRVAGPGTRVPPPTPSWTPPPAAPPGQPRRSHGRQNASAALRVSSLGTYLPRGKVRARRSAPFRIGERKPRTRAASACPHEHHRFPRRSSLLLSRLRPFAGHRGELVAPPGRGLALRRGSDRESPDAGTTEPILRPGRQRRMLRQRQQASGRAIEILARDGWRR